jgi:hypothetical protein
MKPKMNNFLITVDSPVCIDAISFKFTVPAAWAEVAQDAPAGGAGASQCSCY